MQVWLLILALDSGIYISDLKVYESVLEVWEGVLKVWEDVLEVWEHDSGLWEHDSGLWEMGTFFGQFFGRWCDYQCYLFLENGGFWGLEGKFLALQKFGSSPKAVGRNFML